MAISTIKTVLPAPPFLTSPRLPEVVEDSKNYVDDKILVEDWQLALVKDDATDLGTFKHFITSLNTTVEELNVVVEDLNPKLTIVSDGWYEIKAVADNITTITAVNNNATKINLCAENIADIVSCAENIDDIKESKLRAWEAEAERMTCASIAEEAIDVHTKIWTSNGDGTFVATETDGYSTKHWNHYTQELQGQVQTDVLETDKTSPAFLKNADQLKVLAPISFYSQHVSSYQYVKTAYGDNVELHFLEIQVADYDEELYTHAEINGDVDMLVPVDTTAMGCTITAILFDSAGSEIGHIEVFNRTTSQCVAYESFFTPLVGMIPLEYIESKIAKIKFFAYMKVVGGDYLKIYRYQITNDDYIKEHTWITFS